MTEQDQLCAMYTRAGVVFSTVAAGAVDSVPGAISKIEVYEGRGPRNLGYTDFVAVHFFDGAGALIAAGAWE